MKKNFLLISGCLLATLFACGCSLPWFGGDRADDSGSFDTGADQEMYFATLTVDGTVVRDGGQGTCGTEPWSIGCNTYRVWWGQTLSAAFQSELIIVPDGVDRWVITNNEDTLSEYSLPQPAEVYNNPDSGLYRLPTIDFSSTPGCSGAISGSKFATQVMGVARDGYVKLVISPQAVENISGKCGDVDLNQETTTWRWGVAAALAGDPEDMTVILGEEEFIPVNSKASIGGGNNLVSYYWKEVTTDTNPSPQNRDHVEATLLFVCNDADNQQIDCPWIK